jgi:hypothetical protein
MKLWIAWEERLMTTGLVVSNNVDTAPTKEKLLRKMNRFTDWPESALNILNGVK